jgi:hypothetical protein
MAASLDEIFSLNISGVYVTLQSSSFWEADSLEASQDYPAFYGRKSLLCSQELATGSCHELIESNIYLHALFI